MENVNEFYSIPGFEGYMINKKGEVKSIKRKEPKLLNSHILQGYTIYMLRRGKKSETCKRANLLAMAFMDYKPTKGLVIDHIDNDRGNDNLINLQIITHRENSSKDKSRNSKYIGVYKRQEKKNIIKVWRVYIRVNGIKKSKCFETEIEAAQGYIDLLKTMENKTIYDINYINRLQSIVDKDIIKK